MTQNTDIEQNENGTARVEKEFAHLKDAIKEVIVDAVHPEFGWIWRDEEDGGKLRIRAEKAEKTVFCLEDRLRKTLSRLKDVLNSLETMTIKEIDALKTTSPSLSDDDHEHIKYGESVLAKIRKELDSLKAFEEELRNRKDSQ